MSCENASAPFVSARIFALVAMASLAMYPLSAGPVVWLHERGMISERAIITLEETLYLPLIWTCEQSEACENALDRYLSLFE